MYKGVFLSRDPGGANALIPVVRKISEEKNIRIFIFAASFAIPFWKQSGLDFTPLPDSISKEEIGRLLNKINPDFLFTGTSEDTTIEGNFWHAAKHQKIFTYSIIDHWTRYRERYMVNGIFSPTDLIFTIDENSKKEMISLGFVEERIIVSGQPHFEKFYGYKSGRTRQEFYAAHKLPPGKVITFVSDYISGSFPSTLPGQPVLGFDEHTILNALLSSLRPLFGPQNQYQLIMKLHPKEPGDNFSEINFPPEISYRTIKEGDNIDLVFHSDFVIGMFSMLLFEAFLMRKPVLSLQLNATTPISFGQSKIPIVVEPANLQEVLRKFLTENCQLPAFPYVPSVKNIVGAVKNNLIGK